VILTGSLAIRREPPAVTCHGTEAMALMPFDMRFCGPFRSYEVTPVVDARITQ